MYSFILLIIYNSSHLIRIVCIHQNLSINISDKNLGGRRGNFSINHICLAVFDTIFHGIFFFTLYLEYYCEYDEFCAIFLFYNKGFIFV